MLHMMLERGEHIHSAVFFDTGWEFPEMHGHINLVEKKTGIPIVRLRSDKSYEHWMYHQRVKAKKGEMQGEVVRIGCGWPSPSKRWCTREKVQALAKYQHTVPDQIQCVGYASDEQHRCKPGIRYPLIEYGMTEADCLKYCKDLGYTWGGLYDIFKRVSCFCCPLQSLSSLRKLRKYRPELWDLLIEMDLCQPRLNQGFKDYDTVIDIEIRFRKEEKQIPLFPNYNFNRMPASIPA